jgi:hypothetical protein
MAKEGERSAPADKGKGKVDDVKDLGGSKEKPEEKTQGNGKKKDDEPQEGKQHLFYRDGSMIRFPSSAVTCI